MQKAGKEGACSPPQPSCTRRRVCSQLLCRKPHRPCGTGVRATPRQTKTPFSKEGSVAAATTFKYNFIQLSEVFIYVDIWIFRFVFSLCPCGNRHPRDRGGSMVMPLSLKQPSLGRGGGERGGVAVPVLLWIRGKGGGSGAQGGGACVPQSSSRAHGLRSPLRADVEGTSPG